MAVLQKTLLDYINTHSLSTVFDIGCGDCQMVKEILPHIPRYIGADINPLRIEENRKKYDKEFMLFDVTKDPIPDDVDIILCRDLFGNFSLNSILDSFEKIRKSKAKVLIVTTFINRAFSSNNEWQPISLCSPPFFFQRPVHLVNEECFELFPRYIDKSLGIWRIEDIPDFLPRNIFQTWHSKELPPILDEAGKRIRAENPDFTHKVFSIDECEQFMKEHFGERYLRAYQKVIPLAYKADLWRYCVLYVHGGIYLDISYEPINGFRFSDLLHKEHYSSEVRLHPYGNDPDKGVSISIIAERAKSERLRKCIERSIENIETENYGLGPYDIASAVTLGESFTPEERKNLREIRRVVNSDLNGYTHHGVGILRRIKGYDLGLPGRSGQVYLDHWYSRTVFSKQS